MEPAYYGYQDLLVMLLVCASTMIVFALRDMLLFGTVRRGIGWKLALYVILMSAYLLAMLRIGDGVSYGGATALVRSPAVWMTAVAIHGLLWFTAARLKRTPDGARHAWIIALLPAPVPILAMTYLALSIASFWPEAGTFMVGSAAILSWTVLTALGVVVFRRVYSSWDDSAYAAEVAKLSNWTAVAVLPLGSLLESVGLKP
jgi:hypothetical protein